MEIAGTTTWVTGASSGIGEALARDLAVRGAKVVLLARSADKLEAIASELREGGAQAVAHPVDLADRLATNDTVDRLLAEHMLPDIVVHNAGAGRFLQIDETTIDDAMAMMQVPYFAAFHLTTRILPAMIERGSGLFVTVNSPAYFVSWPGSAAYAASRAALHAHTRSLRAETRGTGVRVLDAVFGYVSSSYWEHNEGAADNLPKVARLTGECTPEEAADAIARAIAKDRSRLVRPRSYALLPIIAALAPGLTRSILGAGWTRRDLSG